MQGAPRPTTSPCSAWRPPPAARSCAAPSSITPCSTRSNVSAAASSASTGSVVSISMRWPTLLDDTVCLVSVMLANNETGVVQPLEQIAEVDAPNVRRVRCCTPTRCRRSRGSTSLRWQRRRSSSRSPGTSSAAPRAWVPSWSVPAHRSSRRCWAVARSEGCAAAHTTRPASWRWASPRGPRWPSARPRSSGSARCATGWSTGYVLRSPTSWRPASRRRRGRASRRRERAASRRRERAASIGPGRSARERSSVFPGHRERGAAVPARAGGHHGVGGVVVRQRCAGSLPCPRGDGLRPGARRLVAAAVARPCQHRRDVDRALAVVPDAVAHLRRAGS